MKIYIPEFNKMYLDLFVEPKTRTRAFRIFCDSILIPDYKSFAYIRCRKGTLNGVKNLDLVEVIPTYCPAHNEYVKTKYAGKTFWLANSKSRTFKLAPNQVIKDAKLFFKVVLSSDEKGYYYYHNHSIESDVKSYFKELKHPAILPVDWFKETIQSITGEEAVLENISFFKRDPDMVNHRFINVPGDIVYNFSKILIRYRSNFYEKFLKYIDVDLINREYEIIYDDRSSEASRIICKFAETFDYFN